MTTRAGARDRTVRRRSRVREILKRSGASACSRPQRDAAEAGEAVPRIKRMASTFL